MLEVASAIALVLYQNIFNRSSMQFKLINGDLDKLLRLMISCDFIFLINYFFVNFNMIDDIP